MQPDFGDLPTKDETPSPPEFEDVTIRRRKNGAREAKPRSEELPAHLERRDEVIDVPESERAGLVRIGEDVTERLEFDRIKPWVRRIIPPKYARPGDAAAGVQQAPPPLGVIEGDRYGFSVVNDVLMQRYMMHTPLATASAPLALGASPLAPGASPLAPGGPPLAPGKRSGTPRNCQDSTRDAPFDSGSNAGDHSQTLHGTVFIRRANWHADGSD